MTVIPSPVLQEKCESLALYLEQRLPLEGCGSVLLTTPDAPSTTVLTPHVSTVKVLKQYFFESLSCTQCAELIDTLDRTDGANGTTYPPHIINRVFGILDIHEDRLGARGRVAALACAMMLLYISQRRTRQ
jgi:hypothetical protein